MKVLNGIEFVICKTERTKSLTIFYLQKVVKYLVLNYNGILHLLYNKQSNILRGLAVGIYQVSENCLYLDFTRIYMYILFIITMQTIKSKIELER